MACGGVRHIESSIGVMSSESVYLSFTSRTLGQGKSGCCTLFGMIRGPDKGWLRIQPLATCIDRTGGVSRYSDVIYGQHLISKVSSNFASGTGAPLPQS